MLGFSLSLLYTFSYWVAPLVRAQNVSWQTTPFNPPQFPLAVKSPYTSTWMHGGTAALAGQWPHFAVGGILGWTCYVKVDNTTYTAMGAPGTAANNLTVQTQTEFTTTRTIITSRAGPVDLVLTFLSPLDYTDLVRLSLPFSYFSVSAVANDGGSHSVAVYTDISGEWVSAVVTEGAQWSTATDGATIVHKMFLQQPSQFVESSQRAEWGTVYLASNQTTGTTYQTGSDSGLRQQFLTSGVLLNTQDTDFRGISTNWPVLAISQNLGSVTNLAQVVTFVLGHTRNPAVKYITSSGQQDRSLYFLSKFATEEDAVRFAISDYQNARAAATLFDNKVQTDGTKVSPDYASVLALGTRQAFASMEITLPGVGSEVDLQDVKIFTKDTATDQGSSMSGVFSSIDSLYSIMPMLIYTNPKLGNYALSSLLEYAPFYNQPFAMHDLGLRYSQVVLHPDQSRTPVDASATMIIMTAAFMRYTGSAALAAKHYYTLKKWADYLVQHALSHEAQLTGDWFESNPAANQTNLALKGLIALRSMVEIQKAVGMTNESSTYNDAANNGLQQWIQLSSSGTQFTYGSTARPALLHALYADKLLGLNFVPESVYALQRTQYTSGIKQFGVSLTGADTITSTAWQYFTLAALSAGDTPILTTTLPPIKAFVSTQQTKVDVPSPADVYDVGSGIAMLGYAARGNVGGAYAILALGAQAQSVTPVSASPSAAIPTATVPAATGTSRSNSADKIGIMSTAHIITTMLAVVPCLFTLLVL
ncbi:hypothetical protein BDV93DRAFT_466201 [Ceratobasidium sp. AG-I]|nr:hypothetical protein BDV93DRAFT_466201 [Ceratobasidium sp. AG-I]